MKTITILLFALQLLIHRVADCRNVYQQDVQDTVFEQAVSRFKTQLADSIKVNRFPSQRDSVIFADNFRALLNRELKTNVFNESVKYSDFSYTMPSYSLSIHQMLLPDAASSFPDKSIRPATNAPLELKFFQVKNRLIVFSYSPFKNTDALKNAIQRFKNIYQQQAK